MRHAYEDIVYHARHDRCPQAWTVHTRHECGIWLNTFEGLCYQFAEAWSQFWTDVRSIWRAR